MSRSLLIVVHLVFFCMAARADLRLILRIGGGPNEAQTVCKKIGCSSLQGLSDPKSQLFAVTLQTLTNPLNLLSTLNSLLGITGLEIDSILGLIGPSNMTPVSAPWGSPMWNGYSDQTAAKIVRADDARESFHVTGAGIVAFIDTGVDPTHPALKGVLTPGYDFTREQAGYAPETTVNQSTTAVVDEPPCPKSPSSWLPILNQSTTAVVDGCESAYGHGTMVAGIVHMVAPSARLMPMRAFTSSGQGYLSNVLRAIYRATDSGARVINMSFSTPLYSRELQAALDYATSRGVIMVASVGNDGRNTAVYPAGLSGVMGVASTTLTDQRASFSNYGSTVWVAAPGERIVSTYPGGKYATASGTSFSAPFVAGAAALILQMDPGANQSSASKTIGNAKAVNGNLGHGRLDIYDALTSKRYGQY